MWKIVKKIQKLIENPSKMFPITIQKSTLKWSKSTLERTGSQFRPMSAPGRLLFRLIWIVRERLLLLPPTFNAPRWISKIISGPLENSKSVQNHSFRYWFPQGPFKNVILWCFLRFWKRVVFLIFFHGFQFNFESFFKWLLMFIVYPVTSLTV